MDKYDLTLQRVTGETAVGTLKWEAAQPSKYSKIIVNADRVIRCFTARFARRGKAFGLLFVEKKNVHLDDYGEPYEGIAYELNVLDGSGNLLIPIYEGLVDRDDLGRLSHAISESSSAAADFFDALLGGEE